jgi:UDP-3-O-[3-hydroxymyristoyl] glucosamine N-acyltransferase
VVALGRAVAVGAGVALGRAVAVGAGVALGRAVAVGAGVVVEVATICVHAAVLVSRAAVIMVRRQYPRFFILVPFKKNEGSLG